jgi:hypothetical protein
VWGANRPDWRQITEMSATDYGERLSDRKFERWVNHVSKRKKPSLFIIVLVVFIPVLAVLSLRLMPVLRSTSKQWKLEEYSSDSGYIFSKDGVIYRTHCGGFFSADAIKTLPPGFVLDPNPAMQEGYCSSVLPYLHKIVPMTQGKPFTYNELVFPIAADRSFNEGVLEFLIIDAK